MELINTTNIKTMFNPATLETTIFIIHNGNTYKRILCSGNSPYIMLKPGYMFYSNKFKLFTFLDVVKAYTPSYKEYDFIDSETLNIVISGLSDYMRLSKNEINVFTNFKQIKETAKLVIYEYMQLYDIEDNEDIVDKILNEQYLEGFVEWITLVIEDEEKLDNVKGAIDFIIKAYTGGLTK